MNEASKKFFSFIVSSFWIIKPFALMFAWYVADIASRSIVKRLHSAASERIKNHVTLAAEQRTMMQRAVTIYYLMKQIVRGFIAGVMVFWIFGSIGIDMRPVLAGVGVVGLALSFAAQNIIRDYLNGFFILLEDQFNVGDYISIGDMGGTVESFSFRATRLRDLAGNLITIPNSAIQTVQNYNKEWAAALVEISVPYEADAKKAMEIAKTVAQKMTLDQVYGIIGEPTVQGILTFNDNAVVLRTIIKTEAGLQWAAGREYRLLLKEAFDANGMSFAYPRMRVRSCENITQRDELGL